jgi:tripartite-type tricarboxylate transporter receptor subunit TctC
MIQRRLLLQCLGFAAGAPLAAQRAFAQAWPSKPIRVVVTFSPGGSSDVVARLIQPGLQERLGQTVIVENKPGAGGTIGAADIAKAAPDGYSLLLSNTAPISISPFMLAQQSYDPVKSFTHVGYIGSVPNVFVVHPSVPAKTVTELVAWIRAQTKPVSYGSGGVGSIGHIVGELFKNEHKLNIEHVPYRGSAPMATDLLGGTLQFAIDTLTQNAPHMKEGRLRGLAVTSRARLGLAPDIPTVAEAGYPKLLAENFLGLSAPAGLPRDIADRVHKALAEVLGRPEIVKRLDDLGVATQGKSSAEFSDFVAKQVADWGPVVKASGAKLN